MEVHNEITPRYTFILLCSLALLLASCQSSDVLDSGLPASSSNTQSTDEYQTLDEQYLEISKQVPGFAGFYKGDDGVLVAKIAPSEALSTQQVSPDEPTVPEVREAILEVMGTEPFTGIPSNSAASAGSLQTLQETSPSPKLRLEDTKYTFEQLITWRLQIAAFNLDGVMIHDANEGKNNVYLGVETKAQVEAARARIAKLSLPNDAVELQVVGPYRDLVLQNKELQEGEGITSTTPNAAVERDVTGYVNPPVGGAEIVVRGGGFSGTCTYGFSAKRNGVIGFVSNSHCTRYKNNVDGTEVFQSGSKIGFELVDPRPRGCGIIWNLCRYSDAAFFKNTGKRIAIPRIAGTGPDPYDKTYNYTSKVNGIRNSPTQNEHFIAVTSQTGFTRLVVTNTCTYLKTYGSSSTVQCGAVGKPESGYPRRG